jgi:RimJ/RimL family protein N-acetyltransferase
VLVRLGQEVQEVPRGLTPPDPPPGAGDIRLDPLDERYVPDFERMLDDPDVIRYTRVPADPPPGFASAWVGRYVEGWKDGSRAGFAAVSGDGTFLGMIGIVDLDLGGREGEIGYVVAREARGRGIAQRALRLVTDWALGDLGLQRVELHIDPANAASIRVAERCGYLREGVLRSLHFKGEQRGDVVMFALLPGDPRRQHVRVDAKPDSA